MRRHFATGTLAWTTPKQRLPAQADRCTALVAAASGELRLARGLAGDPRFPGSGRVTRLASRRAASANGFGNCVQAVARPLSHRKPRRRGPGGRKGPEDPHELAIRRSSERPELASKE